MHERRTLRHLTFFWLEDAVEMEGQRFVAVLVARLSPDAPATAGEASALQDIKPTTEQTVRDLTDKEILHLLEEYARRNVEVDGTALMLPAKISFVPIIRRRMQYRADQGELRDTLQAEAAELADWIKTRASSHQTPTAGTIRNQLRKDYQDLSARSKRMIP